jgi:TonB family protein
MKKLILLLFLLIGVTVCQAQGQNKDVAFIATTTPPSFVNNIEGQVLIGFKIDTLGWSHDVKVLHTLSLACDSVALALVKKMPRWTSGNPEPGLEFKLPIVFKLPDKDIRRICDTYPRFPGGEREMYQFIMQNLKYPVRGCHDIQGRVIIRFVVTKDGKIENPVILKSLDYYMDEEALRVIRMMPDWEPAVRNNKKVDSYFIIPIAFRVSG